MISNIKLVLVISFIFIMSGCATFSSLKFWGDEEEAEVPSILNDFDEVLSIDNLWNSKLGKSKILGRIIPSFSSDKLFCINSEGTVFAFDTATGGQLWSRDTGDVVSAGIESKFKTLIYGTLDGEVVVLDQEKASEIWRAQISSEILAPVTTDGNIVVAQGLDGSVTGLDLKTGEMKWIHQTSVPSLSLRGTSVPIIEQGFIFTGFANGSVAMIYPDSGAIRLEIPVTINEGSSELERIVDIEGKSVVTNNVLVSASYQGNITAIDLQQGRPFWQEKISTTKDLIETRSRIIAVDDKDVVVGFGLNSGVILWQQNGLRLRNLTSPAKVKGNIALGDFEGFLHILDGSDGEFLARKKISKNPILEIVAEGNKLAILDDSGRLFFLSIE